MTCLEKGIEYELVPIAYGSDQHGEMHPFRRIPVLDIDGMLIFETLAITGFLDETFDGPSLQPAAASERAQMRTWMGVCGDYLFRDVVRAIPRGREPREVELETAKAALVAVEALPKGDLFLVGDSLTLADLYLAPQIANCEEKAGELLDGLDGLKAWMGRMSKRDSFTLTRPN